MAMKWTEAQQLAIDAPKPGTLASQTLLVAAAAGSGKTAVLVERIISRLKDYHSGLSVEELLVMTFTNAAAAEMRTRIGIKLAEAFEETQDYMLREHLQRQQSLLPSAHISTFDAFCQWLVRNYYYVRDLEPDFRVSNGGETLLMREDVLDEILLDAYQNGTYQIYDLAEIFGDNGSDRKLKDLILQIYTFSLSQSAPFNWLNQIISDYEAAATCPLQDSQWGQLLWQNQLEAVSLLEKQVEKLGEGLTNLEGHDTWKKRYEIIAYRIAALVQAQDWQSMHEAICDIEKECTSSSYNPSAKDCDRTLEMVCINLGRQISSELQDMQIGAFSFDELTWQELLREQAILVRGIIGLVIKFSELFLEHKKKEKVLDFSDFQHMCLELLTEGFDELGKRQPSALAIELRKQFKEVMVDEYQDTNGVQEEIVSLIARKDNRFFVGDVKQSIYGFRLADPTLFMEKYATFGHDVDSQERRIDLAQNFRSDKEILKGTNFIFRQLMSAFKTSLDEREKQEDLTYADAEALYAGRDTSDAPPNWIGGTITFHLLDEQGEARDDEEELTLREKECAYIIKEIKRIKENGLTVQDKDGTYREARYSDIVILLRSTKGIADMMVEAFRREGIPAYTEEKTGYFNAMEVQIMMSLLAIIDNPQQDLPLAAVLRSPLVGLNDAELGKIRAFGSGHLWLLLEPFTEVHENEKLKKFLNRMEAWRTLSRRVGVGELLWRIYEDTNYVDYVSAMPGGSLRRSNLYALYDRAKEYESSSFRGLFRFLRFIDNLREAGQDLGMAKTTSESDDVVRIMTIHHSKGLEFPIVFLANMNKKFNEMDLHQDLILHKKRGLGLKGYFPDLRVSYHSLSWLAVRQQKKEEAYAEEQRLLYVAMTRAKDKLYLVGSCKNFEQVAQKATMVLDAEQTFQRHHIMKANSFLDWVLMALMRHVVGGQFIRQSVAIDGVNYFLPKEQESTWSVEIEPAFEYETNKDIVSYDDSALQRILSLDLACKGPLPEDIERRLQFVYPYEDAVVTPAKISVSEIKRRFTEKEELAKSYVEYVEEKLNHDSVDKIVITNEELEDESGLLPVGEAFKGSPSYLLDKKSLTPAEKGSALHLLMQLLELPVYDRAHIDEKIKSLAAAGHFSEDERKSLSVDRVLAFYESPLGKRMLQSPRIEKEFSFSILLQANRFYENLNPEEKVFLQGILDLAFIENGQWILVDYKTDYVKSEEELKNRYYVQLEVYKEALEKLTNIPVREMYIYSFYLNKEILL